MGATAGKEGGGEGGGKEGGGERGGEGGKERRGGTQTLSRATYHFADNRGVFSPRRQYHEEQTRNPPEPFRPSLQISKVEF